MKTTLTAGLRILTDDELFAIEDPSRGVIASGSSVVVWVARSPTLPPDYFASLMSALDAGD